jgi:hypothetical protein
MSTAQPTYDDILRLFQETDRQLKETALLLREKSLETDCKFQETDRQLKRLFEKPKRISNYTYEVGQFPQNPTFWRPLGGELYLNPFQTISGPIPRLFSSAPG